MMKRYIFCLCVLLLCFGCKKDDPNQITSRSAPAFSGNIETSLEVDLGLSAKWAAFNVGAQIPSQCGSYYAWSETDVKSEYTEDNYSLTGTLVPGGVVKKSNDVASMILGYGWKTPSPEDWQELIDNCVITMASYDGAVGYVATSKVPGYEGRSIFFPCAGYKAASNTNNFGYSAIYWSNRLVPDVSSRAINAFFTATATGSALCINTPPKGTGGLIWCGYPVRGIKKFTLGWDAEDIIVKRMETTVSFNITGNAKWAVSADNGATCEPPSGIGDSSVTIKFPINDTYNTKIYKVTLTSPEFAEDKSFEINQIGIIPDFAFSGTETTIEWDTEKVELNLAASSDVAWTGSVVDADGLHIEGASLNPSSGTGPEAIEVKIPASTDIKGETLYRVVLVTDDTRIPETIRTIQFDIRQAKCPLTPYGTVWGNSFMKAWNDSGFAANAKFTAETATASVSSSLSNPGKDNGYMKGQFSFSFTVAQTGTGILKFTVTLAAATHKFKVVAKRGGETVSSKDWSLGNVDKTLIEHKMTLEKGDIVTISYSNGSSNARLFCGAASPISWSKKE